MSFHYFRPTRRRWYARYTLLIEGAVIALAVLAIIAGLIVMNMGASAT